MREVFEWIDRADPLLVVGMLLWVLLAAVILYLYLEVTDRPDPALWRPVRGPDGEIVGVTRQDGADD